MLEQDQEISEGRIEIYLPSVGCNAMLQSEVNDIVKFKVFYFGLVIWYVCVDTVVVVQEHEVVYQPIFAFTSCLRYKI